NEHQSERLGPGGRRQQRDGAAEKARLFCVADLADVFDVGGREQFAYFGFEIVAVDRVDLGCDLQRHAAALGDPDRLIDSLFRRNATEKGKVGRRNGLWRQKPLRQAMVNGTDPPAPATGRRCASEIEITGIEGKVAKSIWCSGRSSRPCSVVTNGVGSRENREKG